jgi:hypothetical protein
MGDGGGVFARAHEGIHAERIFRRQKLDCGPHFSCCQVNYAKPYQKKIMPNYWRLTFFLCHNIWGVAKL